MSVSSCLLLFILCLSFHFCNCRILGSAEKKSEDRNFGVSISKVADNTYNTRSDHQHAVDPMHPFDEKSGAKESTSGDSISMIQKAEKMITSNQERRRLSSSNPNPKGNSRASISWRVRRHELPSDKDTELFGSDYSPPKTHPPHHN